MDVTAMLSVTLVKSVIGYPQDQRATVRSLGLRRLRQQVVVPDNPVMRGMLGKVSHLVRIEEGGERAAR
jgi:large subunit ribosomal protein L30